MRPVLVVIAGRSVSAFVVMQYLAVLIGLAVGAHVAGRLGEDPNRFLLAAVALYVPAVIGAHAGPSIVRHGVRPQEWIPPRDGSAIFCSLFVLGPATPVAIWAAGLSAAAFLDAASIAIVAGTIVGRLGCLLRGCCTGRPTRRRWGIDLPDAGGAALRRVPTQVLDAGWSALMLTGLLLSAGRVPPGACFFAAVAAYGVGRWLTDFTRQERPSARRLSRAQVVCLCLTGAGGSSLAYMTVLA